MARGVAGGDPRGVAIDSGPMTADQVDRAAQLIPGTGRPPFVFSLSK